MLYTRLAGGQVWQNASSKWQGTFRVIRRNECVVLKQSCSKIEAEAESLLRRIFFLFLLLAVGVTAWMYWGSASPSHSRETLGPIVNKEPVNYATRTFDAAAPPPEMPPLRPGDYAQCDSNFVSDARITGETRRTDPSHGTVTISQVHVTLKLNITVWLPGDASQQVVDHEQGHRQISEFYYQNAEKLAERISASYIGRQIEVTGADLNADADKQLHNVASEITAEYGRELNTEPTQLLFDSITDHGRNGVVAKDAVDHALKNVSVEFAPPAASEQPDPH